MRMDIRQELGERPIPIIPAKLIHPLWSVSLGACVQGGLEGTQYKTYKDIHEHLDRVQIES
jgi:hypothetical protein